MLYVINIRLIWLWI